MFEKAGWEAVHWSLVGAPGASDRDIMAWARETGYVVFTHDLDFSALLVATQAEGPSVIQVRTQNILPEAIGDLVLNAIQRFRSELEKGAIITLDPGRARMRILSFKP